MAGAFQASAFQNSAFQVDGGGAPVVVDRTGGWLTPAQAAAQRREYEREEREEKERKARINSKAKELEATIADAYLKATGKPRMAVAVQDVEVPEKITPEVILEVGQEIAGKLSKALEGTGRRYSADRKRLEELHRALLDFEILLGEREAQIREDDELAAMLLLAIV